MSTDPGARLPLRVVAQPHGQHRQVLLLMARDSGRSRQPIAMGSAGEAVLDPVG
jgi:hypothetical protein